MRVLRSRVSSIEKEAWYLEAVGGRGLTISPADPYSRVESTVGQIAELLGRLDSNALAVREVSEDHFQRLRSLADVVREGVRTLQQEVSSWKESTPLSERMPEEALGD